mgnify:CR=1 FL=1
MKYFKSYKIFEQNKIGAFDNNSWSLKKGIFGPLFLSLINKLSYANKKIQLDKFVEELNELLNDNYKYYVKNLKNKTNRKKPEPIENNKDDIEKIENFEKNIDNKEFKDETTTDKENNLTDDKKDINSEEKNSEELKEEPKLKIKKDTFNYDNFDINKLIEKNKSEYSVKNLKKSLLKLSDLKKSTNNRLNTVDDDYINFETGEVYQNMDEVKNIINVKKKFLSDRIEKIIELEEYLKEKLSNLSKYKAGFKIKKMNEAINMAEIKPKNWSDFHRENVTDTLNHSKVDQIFKNKKDFIEKIKDEKEREKLDKYFEDKLNKLFQKWYHVYDIENIRNRKKTKTSNLPTKSKSINKVSSENVSDAKLGKFQLMTILKKQFLKDKSDFYSSPFFTDLEKSKDVYFIFNIGGNNLFLIKKLFFEDNKFCFKLIGKLSHNNSNLVLSTSYENQDVFNLESDKMDMYLISGKYKLPLIFFEQNEMYSINSFGKLTKPLDLISFNIISLNINFVRELIVNDTDLKLDDIETDIDDDIKKAILSS